MSALSIRNVRKVFGKTTVLDAMSFALYGVTSGGPESEGGRSGASMRSDQVWCFFNFAPLLKHLWKQFEAGWLNDLIRTRMQALHKSGGAHLHDT